MMEEDAASHDDEMDRDADDDDDENDAPADQQKQSVSLSKSWSIASAHVPTFSGGKVTHCYTHGGGGEREDEEKAFTPFLLLPVEGDLALVDASRGTKLGTIRGEDAIEDGDDEGVDQEAISAYALAHNDQFVMTCTRNHMLRQYSVDTSQNQPIKLYKSWGRSGHTLPVTLMEFHPSNIFLATASVDGTVRIWDVRGAYVTHVFRPLAGGEGGSGRLSVTSLSWRNDVSQLVLAIGRDDGSMAIHDLRQADNVTVLRDHLSAVTCMDWWGEEFFVSTGRDAILNLWRIVPEEEKKSSKKKKKETSEEEQSPKVTYRRIQTIPVYEQVEGMVLMPNEQETNDMVLATAGSKGSVRIWKATVTPGRTPELSQVQQEPESQAFGDARGGYMGLFLNQLATLGDDKSSVQELFIAVDAENNLSFLSSKLTLDRTIVGHNDEILDLKVIPNTSTKIVVATNSPQIRIFELGNFSCDILDGHTATVLTVEASPCGRYVASCGKDKTMRIWHLDSLKCVGVATGHTEAIGACGLSRQTGRYEVGGKAAKNGGGAFAVTASVDKTLKRWNLPGADEMDACTEPTELVAATSVRGHEKDINIVSIAPNDSLVATGSQDKTVKLWNATDLTLKATLQGHRRGVWDCQFSPIDRVVATSSGDKTIKLWSLTDYSCVRTFQGHVASALRVRFLTGGLQLVSAGGDGLIKLWTIRTNECEATLDGHVDKVWALDTSPDGKSIVSGGADSKIVVWNDSTQQVQDSLRAEEAETIMLDQKLANHLRHKEFGKALEIALQVDKPRQALKVMNSIIENDLQKRQNGLSSLQKHAKGWTMERVTQVLKYCREWNTRARNSHIAMMVVKAIATSIPAEKLASTQGIPEILSGITPYAERHFDRIDRLYASSYLLDFLLGSMGTLDPATNAEREFEAWEKSSKLVLPTKFVDGRVQVGGKDMVGKAKISDDSSQSGNDSDENDEVVTVGDSSDDDDSSDEEEEEDEKPSSEEKTLKAKKVEKVGESSKRSSDSDSS
jgi:U3 small nucleolar RNA-associated protein 13